MEHDGQLCSLFVFLVWQLGLRKHGQIGDQCLRRGWCLEVRDKTGPTMLSEISVLKSWPFYVWERKTGPISEETGLACCAVWTHNTQPFWRKKWRRGWKRESQQEILVCLTRRISKYVTISVWSVAYSLDIVVFQSFSRSLIYFFLCLRIHLYLLAHWVKHMSGNSWVGSSWRPKKDWTA